MKHSFKILAVTFSLVLLPVLANAQVMPVVDGETNAVRDKAKLLYQRIAGVAIPYDSQELLDMEALIEAGDISAAAEIPTQNPNFINVTVKHFATRISTRDEVVLAPLSDFVATIMGFVRDNRNAKELLTTDNIYKGDSARIPASVSDDVVDDLIRSNNHYQSLERAGITDNLDVGSLLTEVRQRTLDQNQNVVNLPDAAGLITSRAYTEAHAIAGTNRRMVHFSFRSFLCTDVAEWADTGLPSGYIGRDVARAPGGVPETFNTTCKGCHSPMDALRDAFAYIDFPDNINDPFLKHSANFVGARGNGEFRFRATNQNPDIAEKYSRNPEVFPQGHITEDASWVNNLAMFGSKSEFFGWRNLPANGRGVGIKQFGQMLADSKAFSNCMVKRVYRSVCKRNVTGLEGALISAGATEFERNYSLRDLFKYVATSPACGIM